MAIAMPWKLKLHVCTIDYPGVLYVDHKLVFLNLEKKLNDLGYEVKGVETRQAGKGTPPAIRMRTTYSRTLDVEIDVMLRVVIRSSGAFQHKLIFEDLEENLEARGFHIARCESREAGQRTPLAMRITLNPSPI